MFFIFFISGTMGTFSYIKYNRLFPLSHIKKVNNRVAIAALYDMMSEDFFSALRAQEIIIGIFLFLLDDK
jgi:hypothetical protein